MSRRRASSPIGIGPPPPVRPSSASARRAYGLLDVIEITCGGYALRAVVGLDDLVGLAVDRGLLVGLDLGRDRVADRVAAAVAGGGVLLELLLGCLEALGLAPAGLVDGLQRRIAVRVVDPGAADRARLGRRGGLLLGHERVVAGR